MGIRTKKEEPKTKPVYQEYISLSEFNTRKKAWADCYTKISTTRAYTRFQEGREALKSGDMATVKLLAEEARQALASGVKELVEPPYPDPEIERRSKRLGVREWDMETDVVKVAEEIFESE